MFLIKRIDHDVFRSAKKLDTLYLNMIYIYIYIYDICTYIITDTWMSMFIVYINSADS